MRRELRSISPECICKLCIVVKIAIVSLRKINRLVFNNGQKVNSVQSRARILMLRRRTSGFKGINLLRLHSVSVFVYYRK